MAVEDLLAYFFDGRPNGLAAALAGWMAASPRFAAFADTYRDKIRKKIRGIREAETFRDLQQELETAYLLLQEPRFHVVYEPYKKDTRSPDFSVTFRSRLTFNIEVTRIRAIKPGYAGGAAGSIEAGQPGSRLIDTVCSKLGQMLPGMVNVLVIHTDDEPVAGLELERVMARLRERAERRDPNLFARGGFQGSPDFFKHYLRLSAVLVRSAGGQALTNPAVLWLNKQAKHPLPGKIQVILERWGQP
jgi:hypothetical protein